MNKRTWIRWPDSFSDNQKSKIQNRKLAGISVIAFVLVVTGAVASAQQPARKVPRIGYLSTGSGAGEARRVEALVQGLRELGYAEGKNINIEYRFAEGNSERLPELAKELVGLKVDVIVAPSTPAVQAAKQATTTVPIIFPGVADPVASGFVASLARPGGNITGLINYTPE